MVAKTNYDSFFEFPRVPVPGGVCKGYAWELAYANPLLRSLLKNAGYPAQKKSLRDWLDSGRFSSFPGDSDPDSCQRALFVSKDASEYIVNWQERKINDENLRLFTVQPLPRALMERNREQELREFDNILDFIHDGIWIIDGNGITLRINRAMERIAGIRAEEVVGRHVSEPLREGRFKTCVSLRALQAKHTVTLFDDYSNGKRCLNTSTPIFDENGEVWRVIAAIRDITELETLQNRLSDLEVEALAYKLRAQGLESDRQNAFVGQSLALQRIMQDIDKASRSEAVTLILGETGTGKSMAAKTIHEMGPRSQKPFVTVNCGAIPASLMESELFGYEKGAFTGAARNGKPGMLELAAGGTLLLDEIGELSPPMQAKLLHVLDGAPFYRVGGTRPSRVNARIIAATNRSLEDMVAKGQFREDLFYRLRVICIDIPPLRDRKDDILLLASHFLRKIGRETGCEKKLDRRAEQLFLKYSWPGNARELQSVIQSLVTLCERDKITPSDLPSYMREERRAGAPTAALGLNEAMAALEREMISQALAETGSTYKAARKLRVSQSSVVRKAKKYGIASRASQRDVQTDAKPDPTSSASE